MHTLIIDGYNVMHRARSGFMAGDYAVVFNVFRSLRALVEQFKPNRVLFVIEGQPKKRLELFPDYKGNRKVEPGSDKEKSLRDFHRQKDLILDLLSRRFPISVIRHPDHECDDVIYNLIAVSSAATKFTVVSSDTDFNQLLVRFNNVELYNPIKKSFSDWDRGIDYVTFKSLRGDGSDNIPGIPGFGDKTALKLMSDGKKFAAWREKNPDLGAMFDRNLLLVGFETWDEPEKMTSSSPTEDWDDVKAQFTTWEFNSIINDKSWKKFVDTFSPLFSHDDK